MNAITPTQARMPMSTNAWAAASCPCAASTAARTRWFESMVTTLEFVSKDARVKEELVIGKEVEERTQTVSDTVRVPISVTGARVTLLGNFDDRYYDEDETTRVHEDRRVVAVMCGGNTTLEPASLTVNGTGSFLALENVGYSVLESDAGDSVKAQGEVTLSDTGISFGWNVAVNGELTRQNCYTDGFTPQDGAVSLTLAGLTGDTNSLALGFSFADVLSGAPSVQNGTFVVNGDDANAVTFS